ncbi:MAG: ABC transporter permease [Gemmatimonadaceae bacterium]
MAMLLAALLIALLATALALGGFPVGASLSALVRGSIGSRDAVLSATLVRATPLLLTGLAVALAFRAGVMNIGAEGQLLAGATAATAVGVIATPFLGPMALPVELAAAALAGMAWSVVPAWLRQQFGVTEVISTIMMNFLAVHFVSYLVRGPLQEPTHIYPQSPSVADVARLAPLFPGTRLHWGLVIAVLLALVLAWGLRYTAVGFRVSAAGANPRAASEAGRIDVAGLTTRVFLTSGAIAGLAGGIEFSGVTFALYDNLSPGYGYTAIAVALLAGLRPAWIIPSSFAFGALNAGAAAMQREAAVPAGFVEFIQAVIILALLAAPYAMARLSTLQSAQTRFSFSQRA